MPSATSVANIASMIAARSAPPASIASSMTSADCAP